MNDPIDLPLDPEDRLYDPPLVDCIFFDQERRGFAITFVPSDDASSALKEFIFIAETAPDYVRVQTFWSRIQDLLASHDRIDRVVHAGGGSYMFHFADGSDKELATIVDGSRLAEITDRLKQLADAAQIAFLDQSYTKLTRAS